MLRASMALAAFVAGLPVLACSGRPGDVPPVAPESGATPSSTDVVVRIEDDGKTIEVARGARVVFKLPASSGTGYAWVAGSFDSTVLAAQGAPAVERLSTVPGGPKLDVLTFAAVGPGTVAVPMELKRPWGDQPAAKTFKATLIVH